MQTLGAGLLVTCGDLREEAEFGSTGIAGAVQLGRAAKLSQYRKSGLKGKIS
jgi:hypothetical protein